MHTASIRGVVRDAEKRGVAGAEVVLWLRPGPSAKEGGIEDIVRVQTDARGRFRAKLLGGYAYSACAHWTEGQGESAVARSASIVDGVRSGSPLRLEALPTFVSKRSFRFGSQDQAPDLRGPLRLRVFAGRVNRLLVFDGELEDGQKRSLKIPFAGPKGLLHYELDAGPEHLYHKSSTSASISESGKMVDVVPLRVVDADGKVVAGAAIDCVFGYSDVAWREVARVGEDGLAKIRVASRYASNLRVRARAPGFGATVAKLTRNRVQIDGSKAVKLPKVLDLVMTASAPTAVKILDFSGEPLVGALVFAETKHRASRGASTTVLCKTTTWKATGADGAVTFPSLSAKRSRREVTILLPPRLLHEVKSRLESFPAPLPRLACGGEFNGAGSKTIDLSKYEVRKRTCLLPDRSPARNAYVYTVKGDNSSVVGALDLGMLPRCDRRGRFTWLEHKVTKAPRYVFLPRVAWARLEAPAEEGKDGSEEDLVLEAVDRARLIVVDGEDKPVKGAQLALGSTSWSGSSELINFAWKFNSMGLHAKSDAKGIVDAYWIEKSGIRYELKLSKGKKKAVVDLPSDPSDEWKVVLD